MRKQLKEKEKKRKRDEKRDNASTSSSKKARKKRGDDDEPEPAQFTMYINIPRNPPVATGRRTIKKSDDDDMLQRGPFKLRKKPLNAKPLTVGGKIGYDAIVTAMKERNKDRIVNIFMPPPAVPMEDVNANMQKPWPTGLNEEPQPVFDYTELERPEARDSIQQQKLSFNKATKEERDKLEAEYPIGNCALFPNLRIYHDTKTDYYFDLTSTRLGIWATGMSQNKADVKTPPPSCFFDADQRIKNIPAAAPGLAVPGPAAPVVTPAAPALSLSDLLLASALGQNGGSLGMLFPHLNAGSSGHLQSITFLAYHRKIGDSTVV
ncbi:hypothetical protein B0H11DRAFT_1914790 [Mycena galericulata]|nr:hypothetical protein B0H11DRAFT_1914790 [Mycena galericulata]